MTGNERIAPYLAQAAAAQQSGRHDEAAAIFERIIAIAPDHPAALNSLGIRAMARGEIAAAIDYGARAARADPGQPVLWLNLARAQREGGDDAGERASLDTALAIDPVNFTALLRKAQLLQRLDLYGDATRLWTAAIAMAPPEAQRSPVLRAELAAGQAYIEAQGRAFGVEVDAALASARQAADPDERRRFDACVDVALGRRRVYPSVCAGLQVPFLPADEYFARQHFSWMAAIEARTPAIRRELEALVAGGGKDFQPYVAQPANTPENIWSGLDHRLDWSAFYLWRFGERQEAACMACPETAAALAEVPMLDIDGRGPTAFFSMLRPRTRIPPHSGVTNSRAIVHLPLVVPEGCGFRVGGETRAWEEGRAFAFDDTIEHEAWNDSDQLRAVLIFDVWNPHLSEIEHDLLRDYFRVIDASGHRPELPAGL